MVQYIDKNKLEEFLDELIENLDNSDFDRGYLCAIDIFGCYLNTFKAKEVDLEKEIGKYLDTNDIEFSHQIKLFDFAKHFFELGLKAKGE